jgi:hypothetical protein
MLRISEKRCLGEELISYLYQLSVLFLKCPYLYSVQFIHDKGEDLSCMPKPKNTNNSTRNVEQLDNFIG